MQQTKATEANTGLLGNKTNQKNTQWKLSYLISSLHNQLSSLEFFVSAGCWKLQYDTRRIPN